MFHKYKIQILVFRLFTCITVYSKRRNIKTCIFEFFRFLLADEY